MEKADKKADYGYTPLHRAVVKGDVEAVKRLLEEKGIDVNAKNMFGSTVLHLAVGKGDAVLVKLLLERGVNLRIENKQGQTALQLSKYLCSQQRKDKQGSGGCYGAVLALLKNFNLLA